MSDITGIELTLTRVDDGEQGQDGKSAYESAVEGGYSGTEAEFNDALAQASDAVQYFWTDADGVHVTQVPQDDYVQDPTSAGINILINSTNGMQVLDGLTVLAMYSVTEIIGDPDGAHVEVTPSGVSIVSSDGVIAFDVSTSGGTATVNVSKNISRVIEEFPDTFTVPELGNAIAGSTFELECFESGAPIPFSKIFTKGTASSESTSAHTIAYNGTTGFTVTGAGRIRILSVTYSATVAIPAVDMQGEVSVNGNIINETVIENGVKIGTHGNWFYRKWSSGMVEAWYNMDTAISVNFNSSSSVAGTYRKDTAITIPSGIFPAKPNFGMVNVQQDSTTIHGEFHPVSATSGTVYWTRDATGTANITASIYVSLIPQRI